jgi:hypothetical protein
MKSPKVGTLVLVEWEDSSVAEGWYTIKEVEEKLDVAKLCKTAGWVMKAATDSMWLICCAAFTPANVLELSSVAYRIPMACVKRVRKLVEEEQKK